MDSWVSFHIANTISHESFISSQLIFICVDHFSQFKTGLIMVHKDGRITYDTYVFIS